LNLSTCAPNLETGIQEKRGSLKTKVNDKKNPGPDQDQIKILQINFKKS